MSTTWLQDSYWPFQPAIVCLLPLVTLLLSLHSAFIIVNIMSIMLQKVL